MTLELLRGDGEARLEDTALIHLGTLVDTCLLYTSKVDELSASPKNAEAGSIPVPVSVDTCKLEKAILSIACLLYTSLPGWLLFPTTCVSRPCLLLCR